jgi:hypothetical protein
VLRHADARVCLPYGDTFPRRCPRTLLQARAALSTIATRPFPFAGPCPTLDSAANWHSNPIAHRVRRKRQRLPPSLLIENASDRDPRSTPRFCPEAFPIKASDRSSRISGGDVAIRNLGDCAGVTANSEAGPHLASLRSRRCPSISWRLGSGELRAFEEVHLPVRGTVPSVCHFCRFETGDFPHSHARLIGVALCCT